jgi:hypothetical protein
VGEYAYPSVTGWRRRQLPAQFIKLSFQIAHPAAALCASGWPTTTSSILTTLDSNLKLHWCVPCVACMKPISTWLYSILLHVSVQSCILYYLARLASTVVLR